MLKVKVVVEIREYEELLKEANANNTKPAELISRLVKAYLAAKRDREKKLQVP